MKVKQKYVLYLYEADFLKRYKRFFVDFLFREMELTAHCPNTGSMISCFDSNSKILFDVILNKQRKLPFSLEFTSMNKDWIMVNTFRSNQIVKYYLLNTPEFFWEKNIIYDSFFSEKKIDNFKPDFLLFSEKNQDFIKAYNLNNLNVNKIYKKKLFIKSKPILLEIKNVTFFREPYFIFPDAQTKRGSKHIQELIKFLELKFNSVLLFLISRNSDYKNHFFMPNYELDKRFSYYLEKFHHQGGKILVAPLKIEILSFEESEINKEIYKKNQFLKSLLNLNENEILKNLRKVVITFGKELPIFFENITKSK